MGIDDVWDDRAGSSRGQGALIKVEEWEDDAREPFQNYIEFEYSAPEISVDSSGRFVKHEIIGGKTVRQKIGEDPIEVDLKGVCKESTARDLDALRDASYGVIYNERLVGASLTVQFASVSTSPLGNNGAYPIDDDVDELLYNWNLSCIEVDL